MTTPFIHKPFGLCPKCQGSLLLEYDEFGSYLDCLQCGYVKPVDLATLHLNMSLNRGVSRKVAGVKPV